MSNRWIAAVLLLLAIIACAGCDAPCKMLGVTCGDNVHTIYVSQDPQACKSIKVDCSGYGDKGFFDRADGVMYNPFSDETGCGCRAITQEN